MKRSPGHEHPRSPSMKIPHRLAALGLAISALALIAPCAASAAEWAPNTSYAVNAVVTYQGPSYRCLQAHTSLVGWEPPNVPALWTPSSGTPAPTSSPTRPTAAPTSSTATPTPRPGTTPRPTNTARPTNTPRP